MKAKIIMLGSMLATLSAFAQRESVGLGAPGGPAPIRPPTAYAPPMNAEQEKILYANGQNFRIVDKRIYNVMNSQLWRVVSGEVHYKTDDGAVILYDKDNGLSATMALKNYTGDGVAGKNISALAIHTGTYNWGDTPLQLWDCGTPYTPPPPTAAQIKAAQDAAQIAAQRQKEKRFLVESKAVHWLQQQATNGDAGSQCSLGEHLLIGQGCDTNRTLAIYWLMQAANQCDIEASNKLASLKE